MRLHNFTLCFMLLSRDCSPFLLRRSCYPMSTSLKRPHSPESSHTHGSLVIASSKKPNTPVKVSSLEGEHMSSTASASTELMEHKQPPEPTLYRAEGLFAAYKPLNWTSQDVVSCIRRILTLDAKDRGIDVPKSMKSKARIKIGHGGTLDPLAEGVLVIGVGKGTKALDSFLSGSKKYRASAKLGFETTTLDMEGQVTHEEPYDHVTLDSIDQVLQTSFVGKIQQIPPIYSAIRRNGKKLYEVAREEGKTAEDIQIEPREVEIFSLNLLPHNYLGESLPCFGIDVECGGGTYIRSLVRDVGLSLKTRATMTHLVRTKQGDFSIQDALGQDEWNPQRIAEAIRPVS